MKIISGSSNLEFAAAIAKKLDLQLGEVEISQFPNGEKRVWVKENVKGHNVVLVQSFCEPVDEHVIESLLLVDALERAGARHINVVLPWMGYSIQDKVFREGEPIAAKVIASLVSHGYVKRVFLLDLHNSSIPGFFSIPTQHLSAIDLFIDYAHQNFNLAECLVASPDFGGLKRARTFAEKLGVELTNIDKFRDLHTGKVETKGMYGNVEGKIVLLFDDFINSGSTVQSCSELLKNNGAKEVHFFVTHGPLSAGAYDRISASQINSVVLTNSIPHLEQNPRIHILDVSQLFADALSAWAGNR